MTSFRRALFQVLLATCALLPLTAAAAELAPNVTLDTDLRLQAGDLNNADLGTGTGTNNSALGAAEARFKLNAHLNENTLFFWEGRGVGNVGRGGFESSDTGTVSNGKSFLEWRQSYFQFDNVGGQPVHVKAGRQRIKESYGNWWNQNFDALEAGYTSTVFTGFGFAGQNLSSYRTGADNRFRQNDKDIANVGLQGSWQYFYEHFLEARLLFANDHSGVAPVGTVENDINRNDTDGNLVWGGLRASGKMKSPLADADKTMYRLDLMAVGGRATTDTTAPFGTSNRIVTGVNTADVRGYGLDAAVDVPLSQGMPILHFGYAFGSGDNNTADGTDHAFRQPSLAGNFSRIGALSESSDVYGTVLRPDLSNIHIFAAGATMPVLKASDVGAVYRYYLLDKPVTSLPSSGVANVLNGNDRDLGQGVDLLFNMDLSKEYDLNTGMARNLSLRSSLGFFRAGDAYGTGEGDVATRGLVELKISL